MQDQTEKKYTDEELEAEFEEALKSVNEDRMAAVRVLSKATLILMFLCLFIISLCCIIGGGFLFVTNIAAILKFYSAVDAYIIHGVLAFLGLLLILGGLSIQTEYIL
jgi:hypothetical protein